MPEGPPSVKEAEMDAQQIERARQAKRLYLMAFLFTVVLGSAIRVVYRFTDDVTMNLLLSALSLSIMVSVAVITWRFCRSIGIGRAYSAINAVLSPFIFLIQLVVLLRMYAKRTGVRLTFLLGDRSPSAAPRQG
jgi:hypothetical protein